MICVRKVCVYAYTIGLFICAQSAEAFAKDGEGTKPVRPEMGSVATSAVSDQFPWSETRKLSWDDFRGAARPAADEFAAVTHCGIGFKLNAAVPGATPQVAVYNKFYANQSWVRNDAKIPSILEHEQGHFDLCEIYTRKLREQMSDVDINTPNVKNVLMTIYSAINSAYERRQQAYEQETAHGTNINQQKKWVKMMAAELM